jgi:hypothetical protein
MACRSNRMTRVLWPRGTIIGPVWTVVIHGAPLSLIRPLLTTAVKANVKRLSPPATETSGHEVDPGNVTQSGHTSGSRFGKQGQDFGFAPFQCESHRRVL